MNKYFIPQNITELQTDAMGVTTQCLTISLLQYPLEGVLAPK